MRVRGGGRGAARSGAGLALAVVALAGCASSRSPQATVEEFLHALGARDTDRACALLATGQAPYRPLAGDDLLLCSSGLRAAVTDPARADDLAALRTATVTGAEVTGEAALVRADQLQGVPTAYRSDMALVRVDGQWYLRSATSGP